MTNSLTTYWQWFFKGSGGKPGYRRILNRWLAAHLLVGVFVSYIVKEDLSTCSNTVLLPLVGILIGLSFAWSGSAQAMLQTNEIRLLSDYHKGGFTEYVYLYQTAILIILVTLVCWGLAGLKVFDKWWPTAMAPGSYFFTETILFVLASLTLRSCWLVVMGSQWMLLTQKKIKEEKRK